MCFVDIYGENGRKKKTEHLFRKIPTRYLDDYFCHRKYILRFVFVFRDLSVHIIFSTPWSEKRSSELFWKQAGSKPL